MITTFREVNISLFHMCVTLSIATLNSMPGQFEIISNEQSDQLFTAYLNLGEIFTSCALLQSTCGMREIGVTLDNVPRFIVEANPCSQNHQCKRPLTDRHGHFTLFVEIV